MKRDFIYIIAIVVLFCIVLTKGTCHNPTVPKMDVVEHVTVDTVYSTKTLSVPTYIPKYITKRVVDTFKIPANIDTDAIICNYYTTKEYLDTIKIDSIGSVRLRDVIDKNTIASRSVSYDYKIPIITKTITDTIKLANKRQVYVGVDARFDKTTIVHSIGVDLMLKNKKDMIYGINLGVSSSMVPYYGGVILWKIKLR